MSTHNKENISRHWSGFRTIWWIVAILLALLLLLMWLLGHGPGGKSCQVPEKVRTVEKLITAPVAVDTTAPMIALNDNAVVRLIAGETYNDAGAKAVDGMDGILTVTSTGTVDTKIPGEYEIAYTVTDAAGNTATETRKVIVSAPDDKEIPEITMSGADIVYVKTGDLYVDDGAVASDIPDGEILVITEGMVDTGKAGEYEVTYTATDKAGNSATKSRRIIVTDPDKTAPIISLNDASTLTLKVGEPYTDAGAKALDNNDGDMKVTVTGEVDTNKIGEYLLTYSVTDSAGNTAEKVRKVIVVALDKAAPVIKLEGENIINLKAGESYTEAGAKADDVEDGTVEVTTTGKVDTANAGEYIITYSATDSVGNTATETRKVIVAALDKTAPAITLEGESVVNLKTGESYTEAGAKADDAENGTVEVTTIGKVDTANVGEYIVTYTATDSAGNTATETRKVIVSASDSAAPDITLKGVSTIRLQTGGVYNEAGAEAVDKEDGKVNVDISGSVDTNTEGEYTITYSAKDKAGNIATESRKVIVVAPIVTAPSISNAKLYFGYDKANNPKDNDGSFSKIITYLKNNNSAKASIYGFHDPSGDHNYNRGLANRRAESVALIMMATGIQSHRLIVKHPVETTGTGKPSEARRVEVNIEN